MTWIKREQRGFITLLQLQRPEVHHALNRPLLRQLSQYLDEIEKEKTRVVIITSTGEKAFCSGADLKERQTMSEDEVRKYLTLIRQTFFQIESLYCPVIAAIEGIAFGGGMELALACDFRIAAKNAVFALPETSLGIIPGAGGTQRLSRIAGITAAKELIYTAKRISAETANKMGIVSKVTMTGEALNEAIFMAEEIAKNAPLAVWQAKMAIGEGYLLEIGLAMEKEAYAYEHLIPTKDRLEGLSAFQEKRKPRFRGE
ncbi:enoyl-CoA hydratase-related protein [Shimazuella sp. AN120528]|uniref:enoyl-CoA hydratase-related protein n=1 Tax=Shimazuella soli TaxID=1892854 RepID=UPI001F0D4CCF|nr:enoyl-CoA hydratase-related protein [Shimazuella soli]MCH5584028.1 enoyl-CoA hydratase-related protein [Shimazuella soli]